MRNGQKLKIERNSGVPRSTVHRARQDMSRRLPPTKAELLARIKANLAALNQQET